MNGCCYGYERSPRMIGSLFCPRGHSMATHLIDKSAWVRLGQPTVPERWVTALIAGQLAITGIGMLEILTSSRSSEQFAVDRRDLGAMPYRAITEAVIDRALDVQGLMVREGTHRAPSTADLLLAACAEMNGLVVLHYDKDYDLISQVTGQPSEWLVPQGTID